MRLSNAEPPLRGRPAAWPTIDDVAHHADIGGRTSQTPAKNRAGLQRSRSPQRGCWWSERRCATGRPPMRWPAGWTWRSRRPRTTESPASWPRYRLVEDRPYEAILIDVQMPDASGLEAAPMASASRLARPDRRLRRRRRRRSPQTLAGIGLRRLHRQAAQQRESQGGIRERAETDAGPTPSIVPAKHETPASDAASLKPGGRVLVVEDALCMQAIVEVFLRKWNSKPTWPRTAR